MHRIDNWINERSGWIIESVEAEYVNIFVYSSLSGSTYIKFPCESKNSIKGLINIKSNENKCFLWCHVWHLNLLKTHRERITKADKEMVSDFDYESIKFPVSKKDFNKIQKKSNIYINVFCYESGLVYPIHISDEKFKDCMDIMDCIDCM